jgi:hypothetical protein
MDRQTDRWIKSLMDSWTDKQMEGQSDGQVGKDRWMNNQTDGWRDKM